MLASSLRFIAVGVFAFVALLCCGTAGAGAAGDVVFKVFNDTHVAMTAIYNKDSRQDNWGWNDLQEVGSADPLSGKITPIQPGRFFYIRFKQSSYAHCPDMEQDVKIVFAGGAVKVLDRVPVCKVDVHINRP